jgi:hypothetical protein
MLTDSALRVGYNKILGVLFIALGLLLAGLGLMTHNGLSVAMGLMNTVLGVLYLVQPYFVVTGDTVLVKNLFGMTMRVLPYESLEQFEVAPSGASFRFRGADGIYQGPRFHRWLSHRGDWQRLLGALRTQAFD